MTTINALLVPPPPRPAALFCPSEHQQRNPLAHIMQLSKALNQLLFALLWLPVREHNFLNSLLYFWLSLTSGLVIYGPVGGGRFLSEVTLMRHVNFGHSMFHRLWNQTISCRGYLVSDMGQWPRLVKFKGLDWSSNSLFQHVPGVDHKTLIQDNWHPDWNLNRVPPKYIRSITVLSELFVHYLMKLSQP